MKRTRPPVRRLGNPKSHPGEAIPHSPPQQDTGDEPQRPVTPYYAREFLTAAALAARWACSTKTLANHRTRGVGCPFVRIGTAVRYRLSDILAFELAAGVRHGQT